MAGGRKKARFRWARSRHPLLWEAMKFPSKLSDLTGIKRESLGPVSSTFSMAEIRILKDLSFPQKNSLREKRTPHWKKKKRKKKNTESVPKSLPYVKLQILRTSFVTPGQEFFYFYYHWLDNESSFQFSGQWELKAKSFRNDSRWFCLILWLSNQPRTYKLYSDFSLTTTLSAPSEARLMRTMDCKAGMFVA